MSMGGFIITIGMFDSAEAALELMPDGSITCYDTWEDVGQGGDIGSLTHTVKALEPLGIKASQVRLVMNDSKTAPTPASPLPAAATIWAAMR
jgi:aldehyde oxidoreductase